MSFVDRHVVITGAASGIGRATALKALDRRAHVTSIDLVNPEIDKISHIDCDVAATEDWKRVAEQIQEIDCLFLNAGIMSARPSASNEEYAFFNVGIDDYRRIMGVNVDGVVFGLRALVPKMPPGSSIVVSASLAGIYRYAHDPIYALTKHAVVGLTKSLVPTLDKRGIRINVICPNRVDTPMLPDAMRPLESLTPQCIADDVLRLFDEDTSGGVWSKTHEDQPLTLTDAQTRGSWLIRAVKQCLGTARR